MSDVMLVLIYDINFAFRSYKVSVLIITYLAYMCYHMTRKPISVVKAVLENCTDHVSTEGTAVEASSFMSTSERQSRGCAYPPFGKVD